MKMNKFHQALLNRLFICSFKDKNGDNFRKHITTNWNYLLLDISMFNIFLTKSIMNSHTHFNIVTMLLNKKDDSKNNTESDFHKS